MSMQPTSKLHHNGIQNAKLTPGMLPAIFKHTQSGQLLGAPWTGVLPETDLICRVIAYKHTVFKSMLRQCAPYAV